MAQSTDLLLRQLKVDCKQKKKKHEKYVSNFRLLWIYNKTGKKHNRNNKCGIIMKSLLKN